VFVVLALASAAFYGAADFLGGIASRRAASSLVVVLSQAAGLVVLALLLPVLPSSSPAVSDYIWGAASGVAGAAGVALLYRALAGGTMSIVAPITAVCAAAVPVLAALALGERPAPQAGAGILLALVAIALLSQGAPQPGTQTRRFTSSIVLAFVAGVAIGLFFLFLARTSDEAGLWPLIAGRAVSVPLFGVVIAAGGSRVRPGSAAVGIAAACGALDMLANALFLIATRYGPLSLVATLASLYPASTVVLARATLGERLTGSQALGVVCALAAVVLIVDPG